MKDETKQQIHDTLYKYCHDFLQTQEITHAANKIINNPTEDTILEMTTYLVLIHLIQLDTVQELGNLI